MCARLAERDFVVLATDVRRGRRSAATQAGAQWTGSIGELAAQSDVVITALPGPEEVLAVLATVLAALPPDGAWIDMSTATPAVAGEIVKEARRRGVRTLDAPVGGRPELAREGRLVAFVGGSLPDLDANRDVLDALADRVLHVGPPGSGYVAKLLVNFVWFGQAIAAAEAFSIAVRSGLDPETFRLAVQESAAASRFMEQDARALLTGNDLTSFSLGRCRQELAAVLTLGEELNVPLELGERITELYNQALDRYGDVDGELLAARLVAERAGITFGPPPA
jgi:3-hydroxyisobutyrate dehydrogenase